MNVVLPPGCVYCFGPFRLEPGRQVLLRGTTRVNLSARLFNTLVYLVVNHDRVVSRDELEEALWPARTVEENNLPQAIHALRKAMQADGGVTGLIVTMPGRGYQFGLPVHVQAAASEPAPATRVNPPAQSEPERAGALPNRTTRPSARGWDWRLLVIAAAALAGLNLAIFRGHQRFADEHAAAIAAPPHSVAVLPFANLTGDPAEVYFSDGLSEELLDSLGRVGALHVAASASSFALKNTSTPVQEIGRLLHVRTVLQGSVRRDANRVRITARLTNASTGYLIWSHSFESDRGAILLLQRALAEAVTNAVQGQVLADDAAKLRLGGTDNAEAFDAFLQGMKFRNQYTHEGMKQALAAFARAVALDPNYTLAHVLHADSLLLIAEGQGSLTADPARVRQMQDDALAEAREAVAAAPELGEAHRVLSLCYAEVWNFPLESRELARARALEPSNARVLMSYARLEADMGRNADAMALAAQAVALDPLAAELYADQATVLWFARRPGEMLAALHHAEQLGFAGTPADNIRARAALLQGDMVTVLRLCAGDTDFAQELYHAIASQRLGKQSEADAVLARIRQRLGDNGAYLYAQLYAAWGRTDEALVWLETAYRLRDDGLLDIEADPLMDPLRKTAQFKSLETALRMRP